MDTRLDIPSAARQDPGTDLTVAAVARGRQAWQTLGSVNAAESIINVRLPDQLLVFVNEAFRRLASSAPAHAANCMPAPPQYLHQKEALLPCSP